MKTKLLLVLCLFIKTSYGQITLQANVFASSFDSPVSIANCNDDRLFVVERAGKIIVVSLTGVKQATPFLDIDSIVNNGNDERGMLGLAFDPDYSTNGFFYVYFIDNSGNSQIARYSRDASDPNIADANSKMIVLSVTQPPGFTNHKGGNLNFGPDGYLYCGFGDGGDGGDPLNNSQNDQTLLGKMIRIDVSSLPYTIPSTNPYISSAPMDEIWAMGLRNPWRYSFDRITNDLWIADVGQGDWEEINFQPASSSGGENYGWRCYEGNNAFNTTGCAAASAYDFPVYVYPHTGPNSGCSATGGYVYRGTKYSSLFGKYLFSDYCSGNIWGLDESFIFTDYGTFGFGMAAFGEDIYGELYIANVDNGIVYSIATTECDPVAFITNADTSFLCNSPVTLSCLEGTGLTYQWLRNQFPIPGATSINYSPNVPSNYQVIVTNQSGCSDTSEIKIVIDNKPAAVITGDNNFCTGETTLLQASNGAGLTYQWKHKNIDISGATLADYNASLRGNYRVLVTNNLGCTRLSNPFHVTGPPPGGTIVNGSSSICQGDSVEITARANGSQYTYQWQNNGIPIAGATNNNYYASSNGFYSVNVANQFGCEVSGSGKLIHVISCPERIAENISYRNYQLFTIEGKLLLNGSFPESNVIPQNYFRDFTELKNGIYLVNLYDENFKNKQTIKLIL